MAKIFKVPMAKAATRCGKSSCSDRQKFLGSVHCRNCDTISTINGHAAEARQINFCPICGIEATQPDELKSIMQSAQEEPDHAPR